MIKHSPAVQTVLFLLAALVIAAGGHIYSAKPAAPESPKAIAQAIALAGEAPITLHDGDMITGEHISCIIFDGFKDRRHLSFTLQISGDGLNTGQYIPVTLPARPGQTLDLSEQVLKMLSVKAPGRVSRRDLPNLPKLTVLKMDPKNKTVTFVMRMTESQI